MTKDQKKDEAKAAIPAPAPSKAAAPPEPTRVQYIGQTAGSIRLEDGTVLVHHVEPGDVLDPETAKDRHALLDTGHFELTRKRATTDTTTDAPIESAVPDPQESA
ncbi:hypothetical protein DESA109040_05895 [Deinococcus saxicola]|uniref:hypothetical protein n=1 Tax=Deinococcus saxicola TaxID=249406 RepID=UPI0039F018D0